MYVLVIHMHIDGYFAWWNGRHDGFKIHFIYISVGSSPTADKI